MSSTEKAYSWVAIMYPEGMIDDWEECIGTKLQIEGAYCKHDKDLDKDGDERKPHVHIMVCFPGPTTRRVAKNLFMQLAKEGCQPIACGGEIQKVQNQRFMYDYLIHDTEEARKHKKHQYDKSERICFNGYDIGIHEQVSIQEKHKMVKELGDLIVSKRFTNFTDFWIYISSSEEYDSGYMDVLLGYSGLLERLTKGNYQKHAHKLELLRQKEQEEALAEIISKSQPSKAETILENYGKESEVAK